MPAKIDKKNIDNLDSNMRELLEGLKREIVEKVERDILPNLTTQVVVSMGVDAGDPEQSRHGSRASLAGNRIEASQTVSLMDKPLKESYSDDRFLLTRHGGKLAVHGQSSALEAFGSVAGDSIKKAMDGGRQEVVSAIDSVISEYDQKTRPKGGI